METQIRIAEKPADFRIFRDLVVEYEASLPADLRHRNFNSCLPDVERDYGPPNAAFIAIADDKPCGCVAFTQLSESIAVMKKLYVKPQYRNAGIARALLTRFMEEVRPRGFSRIVLDTDAERLQAAYRLYLSLGFEECGPYGEVEYRCPTFMELRISTQAAE